MVSVRMKKTVAGRKMKKVRFDFDKKFRKQYAKLLPKMRDKFDERFASYRRSARSPELRVHRLHGKWEGCLSMNVTGNCRAIFKEGEEFVVFLSIGTHSQLYG